MRILALHAAFVIGRQKLKGKSMRMRAEEIEKVIKWCEEKKKEVGRTPIIERNPFHEIDWLKHKILIQIDLPLSLADKNGIVYDSTLRALYEFVGGSWRRIEEK